MRSLWTALLLTGCTSDPTTGAVPQADKSIEEPAPPENPTPWEYEGEEPSGSFDQAKIEDAIAAAISQLRVVGGSAPISAYDTLMAEADDYCPTYSEYEGSVYWYGGCTTAEGVRFDGYSFLNTYADEPLWGEGSSMSGPVLNTQGAIVLADGSRFSMGGTAYAFEGNVDTEGLYAWSTGVTGAFGWTPDEIDSSWMGGDIRPDVETIAYRWDFGDGNIYRALGSTAGISGLASAWGTVFISDLFSVDEITGFWPCEDEPSGIISVRSDTGHWFQVVYDVESEGDAWTIADGACDGCGTVYSAGENVGQACSDFSDLRDWDEQPW
jgi:hypothetical protein